MGNGIRFTSSVSQRCRGYAARQRTFKKSSTKRVPSAHPHLWFGSSYRHFGRYPARCLGVITA